MRYIWMILLAISAYGYEIVINDNVSKPQRDDAKEVVIDLDTKLVWQDDESVKTTKKDWSGAKAYCENLSFGGFGDWRLPKRMELLSITDKTKYPDIKNGFKNVTAGSYWSSSPSVSDSSKAWYVSFGNGVNFWDGKSASFLVRCVRDSN